MLFNSYLFIFLFVPATLAVFLGLEKFGWRRAALSSVCLASLIYYGYSGWSFLPVFLASIFFNFALGRVLLARPNTPLLTFGVTANLLLLGYYKYVVLAVSTFNWWTGAKWIPDIVLPVGISFYTFQQIAYLVDVKRGHCAKYDFTEYVLFVAFFPQLVAGPIVHHAEMMPQFFRRKRYRLNGLDVSAGLALFTIGLFKKVLLADTAATVATPLFSAAAEGRVLGFGEGWLAALAYAFQIYFDFSGYSDMALGLARLFGIRLPLNFDSPYRSRNIIEFWRRWHMTLSRFLRDYLYFALGGNRHGTARRYVNLMLTMLLGGLWHGAGWNYMIWGGLHGLFLCVNHGFHELRRRAGLALPGGPSLLDWPGRILTFVCAVVAFVFFRAPDFDTARRVLVAMSGAGKLGFESASKLVSVEFALPMCAAMLLWVWFAPSTQEFMRGIRPALGVDARTPPESPIGRVTGIRWSPNAAWAVVFAVMALAAIVGAVRRSEFIYYQF